MKYRAALALSVVAAAVTWSYAQSPNIPLTKGQQFPPIKLRGYGEISGQNWTLGNGLSLLEITAPSEEKARLVQAKFLSDLQVLPGTKVVELRSGDTKIHTVQAEGQGFVAAFQSGAKTYLLSSATEEAFLKVVAENNVADLRAAKSQPSIEVPMWLDRWDKFGFRFYYRPWERPKDKAQAEGYDFTKEFEFAEANDRSGLMLWATLNQVDTAEGLTNEGWWDWAAKEAAAKKLPVGLNIMSGGQGRSWINNRYRDQMKQKMPGFVGGYHKIADPSLGGNGSLSWNATTGKDEELGILQDILRRYITNPNITTVLEPHGELRHGNHDIFLEYGPVADAGFRKYLQQKYPSIADLNKAWGSDFAEWSDVRVPEVASFLGWGDEAQDLVGSWRINYEELAEGQNFTVAELSRSPLRSKATPTKPAPQEWFAAEFDDAAWPAVKMPGNDQIVFMPQRPAVVRRSFDVPQAWLKKHPQVWLYLWDLNTSVGDKVKVVLNGQVVGEDAMRHTVPHWGAYDVSKYLKAEGNQLSIRLPKGMLAYRIYLSPVGPKQYPNLGRELNARWVDFVDWTGWSRVDMARRGVEMIRQVTPDIQIDFMAPGYYADGVRKLALDYGGNFKNTGYMGAFWADDLPALMRGAGLPFSLEPSGPASSLPGFKKQLGLWSTEGIQGIDYFIHIGSIMWPEELSKHFTDNLRLIKLIGKYHAPTAEVAALYPTRGTALTGYPWGLDPNTNLTSGYWNWNVRANLRGLYESDALTESAFGDKTADKYKVVIDTNTSIMDEKLLGDIERYVRDGGTFVTFVQTGRHGDLEQDAWPISQLTGYKVTHIDPIEGEKVVKSRTIKPAPGQDIFSGDWSDVPANGLSLEKVAPDAKDLMLWEDGSVAIGMRPLGKGYIVQIGSKFTADKIPNRIEPRKGRIGPREQEADRATQALTQVFQQLLAWRGIEPAGGSFSPANSPVLLRHYISNNGLYDVWVAWNQSDSEEAKGEIVTGVPGDTWAINVGSGERITISDGKIPVSFTPYETVGYLTPRHAMAQVPTKWFELQRGWWRGTKEPSGGTLPVPTHRNSVSLQNDWAFRPLAAGEDATAFIGPDVDDAGWEKVSFGIWSLPDKKDVKRAILRRSFTVPDSWTEGEPSLWILAWFKETFADKGKVWLDGKLISDKGEEGVINANPDGVLKPGSTHTLAVEIEGEGSLVGARGSAWLWLWRKPAKAIDLAGEWSGSQDAMSYAKEATKIPGKFSDRYLKRSVQIPEDYKGSNVVIDVQSEGPVLGVMVNGKWLRRFHHLFEPRFHLNITPWIKFGEVNEIELVCSDKPKKASIQSVNLNFYDSPEYP